MHTLLWTVETENLNNGAGDSQKASSNVTKIYEVTERSLNTIHLSLRSQVSVSCGLMLQWLSPGYTLETHWLSPGYTLETHWLYPGYTLETHWFHPGYSLPCHTAVTQVWNWSGWVWCIWRFLLESTGSKSLHWSSTAQTSEKNVLSIWVLISSKYTTSGKVPFMDQVCSGGWTPFNIAFATLILHWSGLVYVLVCVNWSCLIVLLLSSILTKGQSCQSSMDQNYISFWELVVHFQWPAHCIQQLFLCFLPFPTAAYLHIIFLFNKCSPGSVHSSCRCGEFNTICCLVVCPEPDSRDGFPISQTQWSLSSYLITKCWHPGTSKLELYPGTVCTSWV